MTLELSFRNDFEPRLPVAGAEIQFFSVGLFYCVIGAVIFFLGKPIGKFVAKGIDE